MKNIESKLKISKTEAKEIIKGQINIAKLFTEINYKSEDLLNRAIQKFEKWNDYSFQLISNLFTSDREAEKYSSSSGLITLFTNDLSVLSDSFKKAVNWKITKLESILERIDLFGEELLEQPSQKDNKNSSIKNNKVFISYSTEDLNLVKIAENNFKESNFESIIIANKRQMSEALSAKVIKGLTECSYFLPILTENSISAQWINQEIGFAKLLELEGRINIYAITEREIVNNLKGFLHQQIDLPYTFIKHPNNRVRSKNFKRELLKLITDIKEKH